MHTLLALCIQAKCPAYYNPLHLTIITLVVVVGYNPNAISSVPYVVHFS